MTEELITDLGKIAGLRGDLAHLEHALQGYTGRHCRDCSGVERGRCDRGAVLRSRRHVAHTTQLVEPQRRHCGQKAMSATASTC